MAGCGDSWLVAGVWWLAACVVLEPRYRDAVSCGVGFCDVVFYDGDTVR